MTMDENLFTQEDPRGYFITLSSARYHEHIVKESGHTEIQPNEIQEAIKSPCVIYQSKSHPERDVYFAKTSCEYPFLLVKIAVDIHEENKTGDVVTSFLSKEIKGGIDEERGPKYIDYNNKL